MISVIIPCYNSAHHRSETLESVQYQTYRDFEIILVDDGSTDQTKMIVSNYSHIIKYIYQDNNGPGAARNNGIRASQGDYFVFLDADDQLLPNKLEAQSKYLDRYEEPHQ